MARKSDFMSNHFLRIVATAGLLCGSGLLVAGKPAPTPTPTPFDPQVVYRYNSPNYTDLRLGDSSGAAAVLVYRSTNTIGGYDAAPGGKRSVVFIEQTSAPSQRLMLISWTQDPVTGAITVGTPRSIYESRTLLYPDFSPDGSKIAVDESNLDGSYSLRVFDVAGGPPATVAVVQGGPSYLRWSAQGDALYYAVQHYVNGPGTPSVFTAYRQPVAGGAANAIFERPNIERWDVGRDGTDSLILNYSSSETGSSIPFATWNGSTLSGSYPQLIGVAPHYTCGNTKMIYQSYSKTGQRGPVKVFIPADFSDVVYTKDNNAGNADWIPC